MQCNAMQCNAMQCNAMLLTLSNLHKPTRPPTPPTQRQVADVAKCNGHQCVDSKLGRRAQQAGHKPAQGEANQDAAGQWEEGSGRRAVGQEGSGRRAGWLWQAGRWCQAGAGWQGDACRRQARAPPRAHRSHQTTERMHSPRDQFKAAAAPT